MIKAKFTVTEVTHYEQGGKLQLEPRYSKDIPEDETFYSATPSGRIEMYCANPRVIEQMTPGKVFFVEFHEAPEGTPKHHE